MDLETIKVLLESQSKSFKTAVDIVLEDLKSRLQTADSTISDLVKSLEFTQAEVKDLQSEVTVLRKSEAEKTTTITTLQDRIEELEKRCNYQEDYSRRNNLRITGIQEQSNGETWEETANTVSKLFEEKLQLPSIKLERAHRTGPATASGPRTIVARFERFGDREAVIRNARKLKGTGIFINEDLCQASLELKKSQFPIMKKAREEGKIAFFKYTKLIIKERTNQRSSSATDDVSTTGGAGSDVSVKPRSEASHSGEGSVTGGEASVRPRTGAAGAGPSSRVGELAVGAVVGRGIGALSPATSRTPSTSFAAAAGRSTTPLTSARMASTPESGNRAVAAGYATADGSAGKHGTTPGVTHQKAKALRNRKK